MPERSLRPCKHAGCPGITRDASGYCEAHREEGERVRREADSRYNRNRSAVNKLEHSWRWRKYSLWFLKQPGNQICKLHLDDGCHTIAECVDHIDPPEGPNDPRFWDKNNHQAACLHCNSVKGKRKIKGDYDILKG
jgi:5-methylcytosine-specific restriction protein A